MKSEEKNISDMTEDEILRKQIQLLAEKSKDCNDIHDLVDMSQTMATLRTAIPERHIRR